MSDTTMTAVTFLNPNNMKEIISGNGDTVLDAYRLPDGDPVLVIGDKEFRFCFGSQPFEQTEIYVAASRLVNEIIKYKAHYGQG